MRKDILILATAAAFAAGANATIADDSRSRGDSAHTTSVEQRPASAALQDLRAAAQRLRESIQAAAQQPPGAARDRAIAAAHEALFETQSAMVALPPEMLSGAAAANGANGAAAAGRDKSAFEKLDRASDRLLRAVDGLAQGEGAKRNEALRQAREALWSTYDAMLAMPVSVTRTATGEGTESADKAAAADRSNQYGVMVVPVRIVQDDRLADGCWARVFENRDFGGSVLTLVGPVSVPRVEATVAGDWDGADSIVTGARATVHVYGEEGFRDRSTVIREQNRIADLNAVTGGLFGTAESLRVTCTA